MVKVATQLTNLRLADPSEHVKVFVGPTSFSMLPGGVATITLTVAADNQTGAFSTTIYVIADDAGSQGIATLPIVINVSMQ
jgi:hypothetical protein